RAAGSRARAAARTACWIPSRAQRRRLIGKSQPVRSILSSMETERSDLGRRPATEAEARALASGIRLRILRLCLDRPLTNKEIAERLDANPATVLHHVRKLVDTGFLAAQ